MAIRILVTGGTFDKEYDELSGRLYFRDTHLHEMLRLGRCRVPVEVRTVMMVDSLEMTAHDRELLVASCRQVPEQRVLITHGTDTMVETARTLEGIPGKTVVLTGSMQPARFRNTDAVFNIGVAIGVVQCLPPGVYLAMNGRVFDPRQARKNAARHAFEERAVER
jgi:L-asparaginase